jgi:hypothetical protein
MHLLVRYSFEYRVGVSNPSPRLCKVCVKLPPATHSAPFGAQKSAGQIAGARKAAPRPPAFVQADGVPNADVAGRPGEKSPPPARSGGSVSPAGPPTDRASARCGQSPAGGLFKKGAARRRLPDRLRPGGDERRPPDALALVSPRGIRERHDAPRRPVQRRRLSGRKRLPPGSALPCVWKGVPGPSAHSGRVAPFRFRAGHSPLSHRSAARPSIASGRGAARGKSRRQEIPGRFLAPPLHPTCRGRFLPGAPPGHPRRRQGKRSPRPRLPICAPSFLRAGAADPGLPRRPLPPVQQEPGKTKKCREGFLLRGKSCSAALRPLGAPVWDAGLQHSQGRRASSIPRRCQYDRSAGFQPGRRANL